MRQMISVTRSASHHLHWRRSDRHPRQHAVAL